MQKQLTNLIVFLKSIIFQPFLIALKYINIIHIFLKQLKSKAFLPHTSDSLAYNFPGAILETVVDSGYISSWRVPNSTTGGSSVELDLSGLASPYV